MPPDLLAALDVPRFHRLSDWWGPWLIEPGHGTVLLDLVRGTDLAAHVREAAEGRGGTERTAAAEEYQTVKMGGGQQVAIVVLKGVMQKSVGSMSAGTSTVAVRRAIRKAAADPDVSAILLAIDSPGGSLSGTADLAGDVAAAAKRKPVWAQIEDMGASAAYWVASQTERVFANHETALVGSIGTLAVVYDTSTKAAAEGVKALVFGTGPIKGVGTPGAPVTDEHQAYIRGLVEDGQRSFDAAVRKGRGLTDRQLEAVKTGGAFGASEALARKLIDGIQSFDATLAQLTAESRRRTKTETTRAASPVPVRSSAVNQTELTGSTAGTTAAAEPDPIAASRAARAAELRRQAGIEQVCARQPEIAAKAIEEGWSIEKAELAAMKAGLANNIHPVGPHINLGAGKYRVGTDKVGNNVGLNAALEAALIVALGRHDAEKLYSADVLEAAHENFRNFSLQGLFIVAAAQNGYHAHAGERIHQGNCRTVLEYAYGRHPGRSAAASTVSMSGILGNVANKEIVAGYHEEDTAWKEIAAVRSVQNFHEHRSYRMLDDMEYEELGPDGKIKHGSTSEEYYTRQAKTFAKMYFLTRTHIINDDLGAFDDLRTQIGRGSSKKFNKVFWKKFIDNAAFFTAGRTNYISGSTTNLGTDGVGLGLGVLAFRKMKSPTADGAKAVNADTQPGSGTGGRPEILLVPPELEAGADKLYVGENLNVGSGPGEENIYRRKYRPVVAWQLSDSGYTGYSTTAWYLLNNPAFLAAIVVSFLYGQVAPTVESAEADFDELGVQFRGFHDFGADLAEYLSGVKSKGAA